MDTLKEIEEMNIKEITAEVVTTVTNAMKEVLVISTDNYS